MRVRYTVQYAISVPGWQWKNGQVSGSLIKKLLSKNLVFVRIDCCRSFLSGVIIMNQKTIVPILFFYNIHSPVIRTAIAARNAFERLGRQIYFPINCQMANTNSIVIRTIMIHSRKFEC
jgi:hypothetical protein